MQYILVFLGLVTNSVTGFWPHKIRCRSIALVQVRIGRFCSCPNSCRLLLCDSCFAMLTENSYHIRHSTVIVGRSSWVIYLQIVGCFMNSRNLMRMRLMSQQNLSCTRGLPPCCWWVPLLDTLSWLWLVYSYYHIVVGDSLLSTINKPVGTITWLSLNLHSSII